MSRVELADFVEVQSKACAEFFMLDMLQLQADIWLVVINTFFTTMEVHCWNACFIQQVREVQGSLQTAAPCLHCKCYCLTV